MHRLCVFACVSVCVCMSYRPLTCGHIHVHVHVHVALGSHSHPTHTVQEIELFTDIPALQTTEEERRQVCKTVSMYNVHVHMKIQAILL